MTQWNRVAIVGVGLIGGAIGQGVRKRKLARSVVGIGRNPVNLELARKLGAIDEATCNLAEGVAQADLVIVCTPVGQIVGRVCEVAAACGADTLITDAGSTKAEIVRQLEAESNSWRSGVRFVGCHPLAGNEKRGPQADMGDLLVDRVVVVTPTPQSRPADVATLDNLWTSLGARVVHMSPEDHDHAVAITSHLPHLVASAIAGSTPEEYVTLTAGGWQDTTRIAAGDPDLWQQIMLANRSNLLEALARFEKILAEFGQALRQTDAKSLQQLLAEAKRIRDAVGN